MIKTNKVIALDVDGVLLCFYSKMCERFGMEMEKLSTWSCDWINEKFNEIKDDKEFWRDLPMITKPSEITFDFDYYVTALPPQQKDSRLFNLLTLGYPHKPIIVCDNKHETCKRLNIDILIDDKPSTIDTCREHGINAIYFKPHYYADDFREDLNPIRKLSDAVTQFENKY